MSDIDELVQQFEHEFDVATELLEITQPVFDGRIGDPKTVLKNKLTRFFKHRLTQYGDKRELDGRIKQTHRINRHVLDTWKSNRDAGYFVEELKRLVELKKQGEE